MASLVCTQLIDFLEEVTDHVTENCPESNEALDSSGFLVFEYDNLEMCIVRKDRFND